MAHPHRELLSFTADRAIGYPDGLAERPVGATADAHLLTTLLGGPLSDGPGAAAEPSRR